jgi:predicted flap endonuclease-1-like 5' DNA nuclease
LLSNLYFRFFAISIKVPGDLENPQRVADVETVMAREEPAMLLDRIDIDTHGPLTQVALGPFSQTLNAVVSASGSGKTALIRFLRDSLTGTTPARDGLADSRGRVVWSAADGLYHCRREPNGSAEGRRFVEFESRLADAYARSRSHREAIVVDLPECVVDGIVTDTVMTSVQRCVQAAIASGLDHTSAIYDASRDIEINDLRREIADLERQIHSHTLHANHASARVGNAYESFGLTLDMKRLRDRRAELTLEISAIDARKDWAEKADAEMERRRRKRELFASIADEVQRLRRQESDLKLQLAEIEASLERMDEESSRAESRGQIAKAYHTRLSQVDVQLTRVRRIVREIRALGDHWFGGRALTSQAGWLEQTIDGVSRIADDFTLDHDSRLIHSADDRAELDISDRGWSAALANTIRVDDSVAASSVDVQRRIDSICRMVDNLVGRCEEHQSEKVHPHWEDRRDSRTNDWDSWAENELHRHERRRHPGVGAVDNRRSRDSWSLDAAFPSDRSRNDHPRGDLDRVSSLDALESLDKFEPTRNLDRAERLLQEERTYRAESLTESGENVAWIAGVLNGISQRLRGLAGRRAPYGASNTDPLFHLRRDENSITDPSNLGSMLDPQAQIAAVRRCERELVEVLRQLVVRRDVMLRRIAEAQNLPLSQVVSAISDTQISHDDPQLYQWLVRDRITASESDAKQRQAKHQRLTQQRDDVASDLKRTQTRTTDRVAEAETIRMYLRSLPVVHRYDDDSQLRSRLVAEIKAIDDQLSKPRVHPSILERHAQCVSRLQALTSTPVQTAGLAGEASEQLRMLSGGRLNHVRWHRAYGNQISSGVEIDGRSEASCSVIERFLAAVAVRLAAADELARRGRALPVVIETPSSRHLNGQTSTDELRSLLQTSADALAENARRGRQIIVFTDDAVVADAIARVGGSVQSLRGSQQKFVSVQPRSFATTERMFDINRDFDLAWREASDDQPIFRREEVRPSEATIDHHYSSQPSSTVTSVPLARSRFDKPVVTERKSNWTSTTQTVAPQRETRRETTEYRGESSIHNDGRLEAVDLPFFLTGHNPVDQAPSIDLQSATRLRAIGVQNIEQLLAAAPKQIADSLGLPGIDATTVRRWQHECRLVCGVKKLRPFDARVLAGCGITHPRELAEIDPASLVERVESFLSTERGESLRRLGTSQDVSRLNDWLDKARRRSVKTTPVVAVEEAKKPVSRFAEVRRATTESTRSRDGGESDWRERRQREQRPRDVESVTRVQTTVRNTEPEQREPSVETLKFYLQRSSDVEAGPSIGPKMAERLHRIGVVTVDDLLNRSAASIADELKIGKVDKSTVRQWQQQAALVCQVPMLRGHDAQLLVAAGITEPSRLATCEASWLLKQIEPVASSREGKTILRGGKHPDLAEMREWISNAQRHRELVAA